jgi:hypothetical protein
MNAEEMMKLMTKRERICPELRRYIQSIHGDTKILNHPLVQELFVDIERGALLNARLAQKKKMLKQALKEKNILSYIFLHERPYRLGAFIAYITRVNVSGKQYWETLMHIWCDSENIWQNKQQWMELLNEDRPNKHFMMDVSERKFFKTFKNEITVYRGYRRGSDRCGLSWTMSIGKAEWFAQRYHREHDQAFVLTGKVSKEDIHAYTNGRNEQEIITQKVREVMLVGPYSNARAIS